MVDVHHVVLEGRNPLIKVEALQILLGVHPEILRVLPDVGMAIGGKNDGSSFGDDDLQDEAGRLCAIQPGRVIIPPRPARPCKVWNSPLASSMVVKPFQKRFVLSWLSPIP